ncbi:hypothetical protein AURDEDRAFT_129136 [Auricularia subglabra TFB-10046 SS5]|uniref:Uncharacterized protein n=1 Tax=Auricularia subglabra (strain TFB-10046 / SS5) TaxID=717982 RepID=J0WVB3_AURST|nr:hypothetical protein AURDEDRAFT_129136 [Auricularia subglabra TFB-10046 SS5]
MCLLRPRSSSQATTATPPPPSPSPNGGRGTHPDGHPMNGPAELAESGNQTEEPYLDKGSADFKTAISEAVDAYHHGVIDGMTDTKGAHAPISEEDHIQAQYENGFSDYKDGRFNIRSLESIISIHPPEPRAQSVDVVARNEQHGAAAQGPAGPEGHAPGAPRAARAPSVELLADARDAELRLPRTLRAPTNPPAPQPPTHKAPRDGPFILNPLPGVGHPDGTDCTVLAGQWNAVQRQALFNLGEIVGWMKLEGVEDLTNLSFAVAVLLRIWEEEFPGERPPQVVMPYENEEGDLPESLAFFAERRQVAHLTSIGTWSSSWAAAVFFPNKPIVSRYACTFGGRNQPNIPLSSFAKMARMVKRALRNNPALCDFIIRNGRDPEAVANTLELEHLVLILDGIEVHLWNVLLTPPLDVGDDYLALGPRVLQWRELVARLRPEELLTGRLRCYEEPFQCEICGSLRHPQELCPAVVTEGWMGFIPFIPAASAAVAPETSHVKIATARDSLWKPTAAAKASRKHRAPAKKRSAATDAFFKKQRLAKKRASRARGNGA